MCTISFFPKDNGYVIGMNRDERLARPTALPPRITGAGTMEAVYPRAEEGGTWIAANAQGISFALLNRDAAARHTAKLRSRGEVIPALLETEKLAEAAAQISSMDLRGIHPFRLAGFFPREQAIAQWNWDAEQLQLFHLPWRARHWFSSGISDELAREVRGLTCMLASRQQNAGTLEWLRELHASHIPARGSFSICVHRPDAASVSYTEISYADGDLTMRYRAGHPCAATSRFDTEHILRVPAVPALAAAS